MIEYSQRIIFSLKNTIDQEHINICIFKESINRQRDGTFFSHPLCKFALIYSIYLLRVPYFYD